MTTILDSISATRCDIKYYRNDTFSLVVSVTDENGDPVDLIGKDLKMQIKRRKTDATAIAELTSPSDIAVSGADNNTLTFSGTYDLECKNYYYDLENTTDKITLFYGKFMVTGDVTR